MVAEACKTKMAFRVRGSELSLDALKPINRIMKRRVHNLRKVRKPAAGEDTNHNIHLIPQGGKVFSWLINTIRWT